MADDKQRNGWWPDEKLSHWERWHLRWYKLRWKAFLWWVPVPVLGEPKTIVFPLLEKQPKELRLTDIARNDFDLLFQTQKGKKTHDD